MPVKTINNRYLNYKTPVGDGVTDDYAALQYQLDVAADTGEPLILDPGKTYLVLRQVIIRHGTRIIGRTYRGTAPKKALIKSGATLGNGVFLIQAAAEDIVIENLAIDATGRNYGIDATQCAGIRIEECDIFNVDTAGYSVNFDGACTDLEILRCNFYDTITGVSLRGNIERARVQKCVFTEWENYGIEVHSNGPASGPKDVTLDCNEFHTPSQTIGTARQPIKCSSASEDDVNIVGLVVRNNRVNSPGTPHSFTSSTRGTSDSFSIAQCDRFIVEGNHITGSGEIGMTIELFSKNGVVRGNVITGSDSHGIQIGSTNDGAENVLCTGNTLVDNGVRNDGSGDVHASIFVHGADRCAVQGNLCLDTRTPRKLKYGIYISESTNIYAGPNAVKFTDTSGAIICKNNVSTLIPDMVIT